MFWYFHVVFPRGEKAFLRQLPYFSWFRSLKKELERKDSKLLVPSFAENTEMLRRTPTKKKVNPQLFLFVLCFRSLGADGGAIRSVFSIAWCVSKGSDFGGKKLRRPKLPRYLVSVFNCFQIC